MFDWAPVPVASMAACPGGPLLAIGYESGDLELWDLGMMACVQVGGKAGWPEHTCMHACVHAREHELVGLMGKQPACVKHTFLLIVHPASATQPRPHPHTWGYGTSLLWRVCCRALSPPSQSPYAHACMHACHLQRVAGDGIEVTSLAWAYDALDRLWRCFAARLDGYVSEVDWRAGCLVGAADSTGGVVWSLAGQPLHAVKPGMCGSGQECVGAAW